MADAAAPLESAEAAGERARPSVATSSRRAPNERVEGAVRELERELSRQARRRWALRGVVLLAVGLGVLAVALWREFGRPPPAPRFTTHPIERRDIAAQVLSTGTVKPVTEVQVGAQVSGRIVKLYADFNSVVTKGQVLAELDPSLFGAQVHQVGAQLSAAKANLARAQASLRTAELTLDRLRRLHADNLATDTEVDRAQGERDIAQAEVGASQAQINQLQAQLASARTTLGYTRIFSPIDGVVVNRAIDVGQTVAASFSAPVLFVIAQDLSKMQVLADIDEADVGQLKERMKAEVVVDAFPGEVFAGLVTQIRYSPNVEQGVVTYSAVIDVANPEQKLRPGMTATVTMRTAEVHAVLAARNSALRFQPLPELDEEGKPKEAPPPAPLAQGHGRVYVPVGAPAWEQKAEPRVIGIGITDGVYTELVDSPLAEGTALITEEKRSQERRGFRLF